ncbi:primosomal protein [bacterium]|nr:primosomal protein [bacterium]
MSQRQLLVDYLPFEISREQINESLKTNGGRLVVHGVLQRADAKNQNGRVYPGKILAREAKKYAEGFINQKRAMGELDHPESSVVNLQNVSHNVTEMHWEGTNLVGTVEVLGTPSGNILTELFKAGIKLGISSRGMGSVEPLKEGDGQQVGDDYEIICFDFVSNPSTHGAFLYPLKEGVDKQSDNRVCGKYCKVEDIINHIIRGE